MGELLGGNKDVAAGWFKASAKAGCGGANTTAEASISCMRSKSWQDVMLAIKPPGGTASLGGMGDYGPSRKWLYSIQRSCIKLIDSSRREGGI
jgi:hypothetical protein